MFQNHSTVSILLSICMLQTHTKQINTNTKISCDTIYQTSMSEQQCMFMS